MLKNDKDSRTNYGRRALGLVLCLCPLGLVMLALGWGQVYPHRVRLSSMGSSVGVIAIALLLGIFNFYLAFVRPAFFQHRPDYRSVSGIPMIGTLLVIVGIVLGFGGLLPGILGMVVLLLDTGGLPWFLVSTWRDSSLWDT